MKQKKQVVKEELPLAFSYGPARDEEYKSLGYEYLGFGINEIKQRVTVWRIPR